MAGAVGEISGRVYDGKGRIVSRELDERVLGIPVDQLRFMPHVIGTSYGAHRADATIIAARAGIVDTLIIDVDLADAILRSPLRRAPL